MHIIPQSAECHRSEVWVKFFLNLLILLDLCITNNMLIRLQYHQAQFNQLYKSGQYCKEILACCSNFSDILTQIQNKDATHGVQALKPRRFQRDVDVCTQIFWTGILKELLHPKQEAGFAGRRLQCLLWTCMLSSLLNSVAQTMKCSRLKQTSLSGRCAGGSVISCSMLILGTSLLKGPVSLSALLSVLQGWLLHRARLKRWLSGVPGDVWTILVTLDSTGKVVFFVWLHKTFTFAAAIFYGFDYTLCHPVNACS